jgi:chromosome segregation ATPase
MSFLTSAKKGLASLGALGKVDKQVISLVHERLTEQDGWNDLFSTKLIELLDKTDAIRSEIRKRLDQISAASRAQQEVIRAAEEHRALNADYQKTSAALAAAQEKFARSEKILVDAADLKQRSAAYEVAERQVAEARQALQKSVSTLEEARSTFQQAQQSTTHILEKVESSATAVESARKDAESKLAIALQKFDAANTGLSHSANAATQAAARYDKATEAAQTATAEHSAAISKLADAQSALDGSSKKLAEATCVQEKAAEDGQRAEERLNQATVEKQEAGVSLLKAGSLARLAASYALVAVLAAVSICLWGVIRGVTALQYGSIAPAVMTVVAVAFGVYVWRKSR